MATIVVPTFYEPFVQQAILSFKNLISMGFVELKNGFMNADGGDFSFIPYHEDYETIATNNNITATKTLTPVEVDDYEIKTVVFRRGDSVFETEVDKARRGSSALGGMAAQFPLMASKFLQADLINCINGAFASGGALESSNVVDITGVGDGTPELARVDGAVEEVFGELVDDITGYIINSRTASDLKAIGLVEYVDAGMFGEQILFKGTIPTYNGKPLLVNNTLCPANTTPNPDQYPMYAVGGKPFWIGRQLGLTVKEDENILVGGGKPFLAWYQFMAAAVKGVSYAGAAQPTGATLATAGSWTKKWRTKDIKIVKIITKKLAAA